MNPLVDRIERHLKKINFHELKLVHEMFDEESFGNAGAEYAWDDLVLRFVRDRGHDSVEFAVSPFVEDYFIYEDLAVALGWLSMEEVIAAYKTDDLTLSPLGPVPLELVLERIFYASDHLSVMFATPHAEESYRKLIAIRRERCDAIFRQR